MPTHQAAIFAEGEHHYALEYRLRGHEDPAAIRAALASLSLFGDGGPQVLVAFGDALWRALAPAAVPDGLRAFQTVEGPGRMRGGCGMMRHLKALAPRTTITIGADRRKFTPWGLEGGHHATGSNCIVISPDGSRQQLPTKVHTVLNVGDELLIQTGGGGGWGDPTERDRRKLAQEVADGLISRERAGEIYGLEEEGS